VTIGGMVRVFLVCVTALCAVASANAPVTEATKLFEQGRALAKQGKYAEACERFEKSLELDPAIGTQLNYADCHEKLGRHVEAWRLFDAAADAEKMTKPERAKYARERADALLPKLGVIVLKLATPDVAGLSISIGGRSVEPAGTVREIVEPGSVPMVISVAGRVQLEETRRIAAGKTLTIDLPAFDATPETVPDTTSKRRRPSRVYLAYGIGGFGAASFVTGVVLGFSAKNKYEAQFTNHNCMDADSAPICNEVGFDEQNAALQRATMGTVFGIGGLVLLASGAVLFVTAPRDLVIAPTATLQSAGLSLVGSF
jgi:tetratricopeptide (TPR) repeat protein